MARSVSPIAATAVAALAIVSLAHAAAAYEITKTLATKTPYWDQSTEPAPFVRSLSAEEESQYTLLQVQTVVRHGTRFPTKGNAGEIQDFLTKLQTNYGAVLPAWLQTYKLPYNASIDGLLASSGAEEAQLLGARSRQRIGSLLPAAYSADKFFLSSTYKSRTKDTGVAFASTFFSNPADVKFTQYSKDSDLLLRFFDQCPRYVEEIGDNDDAFVEANMFKASPAYLNNIEILRKALNLPTSANLTTLDVESAYAACAFDIAMYKTQSNWCSLLTEEFVKSSDFADDLETFVESSAGAKISYEISSVLLKDIYKYMKDMTLNQTTIVGNFRFVHGETTTPLMTLLGYTDKTPLLASYTPAQIDARQFRGSRLALFLANLEFRLYAKNKVSTGTNGCDSADEPQPTKYYVQIRINEQVTAVPGCGKVFCELAEVEKLWDYYLNTYDFDAECKV